MCIYGVWSYISFERISELKKKNFSVREKNQCFFEHCVFTRI